VLPAGLELVTCDPARDGELIRSLTRANFYEAMKTTWIEARHLEEPKFPERYQMVRRAGETIGFFAIRRESDHLYLQTIQLIEPVRGSGLGTLLLAHIREVASGLPAIRLRVLRANAGARRLYDRLGYREIGADSHALILELRL
jgi:ribosomal protein S18 acetylase RimI-like enzyme